MLLYNHNMKKLGFLVATLAVLMAGYVFKSPISAFADSILYHSPCDTPRTYHIGSIDPKYNLTQEKFIFSINQASDIWSNAEKKELFSYDPKGTIQINLVYDQRSLLNSQINDLNSKVKEQQNALDPQIADYKKRSAEFRAKITQLNNDIEYWNGKGGAPPDEYEKLINRQKSLQIEADSLKNEAVSLNQSTNLYNEQVGQLHQTVDSFNQELSFKPEEGEYIYDNGEETINIYFDNSQSELEHTLAHELGHALGIGHNNNVSSIMYPRTTEAISLSADDKVGLEKACQKQSVVKTAGTKLALIIRSLRMRTL